MNSRDPQGLTPLHAACANGRTELVESLLEHRALSDARAHNGATPLMVCAQFGSLNEARIIIHARANLEEIAGPFGSALGVAISHGNQSLVQLLCGHGANKRDAADLCIESGNTSLLPWVHQSCTRLHHAALLDVGVVVELLRGGEDPNQVCEPLGLTAGQVAQEDATSSASARLVVDAARPWSP